MSTTQYLLTNRVSGREKLYRAGSGRAAARGMHALPGPCRVNVTGQSLPLSSFAPCPYWLFPSSYAHTTIPLSGCPSRDLTMTLVLPLWAVGEQTLSSPQVNCTPCSGRLQTSVS